MKEENETIIKALIMFGRVPETYELLNEIDNLNNIIDKLQEKIDKAIEYLEQPYRDNFDYSKAELLNILNGGDDNVK